jgi:C-terminal processing protease CtpA/Prc
MNKTRWIPALLLAAIVAVPAFAGGSDCGKCTENTQACLDAMVAKLQHRGWVGIELDKDDHGKLTVTDVIPDSPAQRAGLRDGDVLVALNGVAFGEKNKKELHAVKKEMSVGKTITYTVKRDGYKKQIDVTLGKVPDEVLATWVGEHMLDHAVIEVARN